MESRRDGVACRGISSAARPQLELRLLSLLWVSALFLLLCLHLAFFFFFVFFIKLTESSARWMTRRDPARPTPNPLPPIRRPQVVAPPSRRFGDRWRRCIPRKKRRRRRRRRPLHEGAKKRRNDISVDNFYFALKRRADRRGTERPALAPSVGRMLEWIPSEGAINLWNNLVLMTSFSYWVNHWFEMSPLSRPLPSTHCLTMKLSYDSIWF